MDLDYRNIKIDKTKIDYLFNEGKAKIYIKRDDLIGFSFGGNKVRIAAEIFEEIRRKGYTAVISYGSYASNLNRVIAQMACYYGIKCYIVCKQEKDFRTTANMKLAEYSGAEYIYCDVLGVRESIEKAIRISESRGERPYYVYGNSLGEGNEEVLLRAYKKAYNEIKNYSDKNEIHFDSIYLASGTGMTQAGLIAGRYENKGKEEIRGISVARKAVEAKKAIVRNLVNGKIFEASDIEMLNPLEMIKVNDLYLDGGYGFYGEGIADTVKMMVSRFGIALDPVYSGKAFYGMLSEIRKNDLEGSFLFIHTGGMPGFFDFMLK
ncbi:MAG: pyridoxal-phosphate dependent enzyme [Eubacteriales bacterium]|nr:pyridoxal-phosphate dependent enzyme [Eubacteriales bacterium]